MSVKKKTGSNEHVCPRSGSNGQERGIKHAPVDEGVGLCVLLQTVLLKKKQLKRKNKQYLTYSGDNTVETRPYKIRFFFTIYSKRVHYSCIIPLYTNTACFRWRGWWEDFTRINHWKHIRTNRCWDIT